MAGYEFQNDTVRIAVFASLGVLIGLVAIVVIILLYKLCCKAQRDKPPSSETPFAHRIQEGKDGILESYPNPAFSADQPYEEIDHDPLYQTLEVKNVPNGVTDITLAVLDPSYKRHTLTNEMHQPSAVRNAVVDGIKRPRSHHGFTPRSPRPGRGYASPKRYQGKNSPRNDVTKEEQQSQNGHLPKLSEEDRMY